MNLCIPPPAPPPPPTQIKGEKPVQTLPAPPHPPKKKNGRVGGRNLHRQYNWYAFTICKLSDFRLIVVKALMPITTQRYTSI